MSGFEEQQLKAPSVELEIKGMTLFDAGRFAEAEAPLRECLALRDELRKMPAHIRPYGSNDDWLVSMNNLGRCYEMQGRLQDARPLLEECLKRRRATFQKSNEIVQLSFKNLANLLEKLGRLDEAESLRATAAGEAAAPEPEAEPEAEHEVSITPRPGRSTTPAWHSSRWATIQRPKLRCARATRRTPR